ncbi:MAG: dITP/XTP pyrophosphatase [Parcubacteria group bacterium Gr01-1014_13]|nr:MAG: dITP/XTP pyrophosphatase [Parcubacteria group bacterium Gr01-1014_13]
MRKILIATSNIGKFTEITAELEDLQFKFVNLKDLKLDKFEVEEPHSTTWQNALEKAKFFAKKSGLLTVAEDTGLFVDHLDGAPGVKSKRYGATSLERNEKLLAELKNVPDEKRGAYFETAGCIYNPGNDNFSIFIGKARGVITKKINQASRQGMSFDSIFYYPPLKKTFAELSMLDKNRASHRGQMVVQLKIYLMTHYSLKQVICAAGIIVKDRKMLMTKRRDLRPAFNNKWEFPGGGVENGETFDETLYREVTEETGYKIQKIEQLPDILTATALNSKESYQVHLFMSVCKIKSGKFNPADAETSGHGWFTYQEALKMPMLPLNKKVIQSTVNKKILKKYID